MEEIIKKLNQEQLIEAIYQTAKNARTNFKRKERTSIAEISSGLVSRAKSTTLVANSWKATQSFNKDIDHLKILLKYVF